MNWTASWIWHPPEPKMDNFYLYARGAFSLNHPQPEACVFVTAGSLYKLYVNGQFVGRGPNPSDPSRYYYDVHEVGGLLRKGANAIAAVCYNYGEKAHGILGQNWGRGGFLLELRASRDGEVLLATDDSWRVLHAPEWDQNAAINCTLLGDFKETHDSRLEVPGWREPGFDDSTWTPPEVLGRPPVEPYTRLVEREIPFLGGETVYPVNVFWESASVTYAWRDDWEVYHEQRLVPGNPYDLSGRPITIAKTHDDFSPSVLLDFGRIVTGYPEISVKASAGGVIDVLYGESLHLTRVDRFILKGGPQVLQPFNRRTFRYLKLLFVETPQRIELDRVSVAMNTYPVEHKGSFACSDPLLTRIWEIGRTTMRLSMLDHYVDCPWRERTIYGGDVYPENLIAHYAFGDPRMTRKVLRQMFAIQYPEGALPPYGPYRGCDGFYPSWSAFFGLSLLDHYALTADRELLEELWPNLARLLDWTLAQLEGNSLYLIGDPATGGKLDHWMREPKVKFTAWSNLPFHALLSRSSALARERGRGEEAARWASAADRMAAAIREHLVDEQGLFAAYPRGQSSDQPGQYDCALLLWAGILDLGAGKALAERMFDPSVTPIASPFHGLFVTEGLFRYGEDQKAVAFIREYWGDMLRRGATTMWEHFSLDWPMDLTISRGTSLCHGWSAGPTYSLPAHILGIQPLEPGFAKVFIEPRLCDLSWADGTVPTPHGPVSVRWSRPSTSSGRPEPVEGRNAAELRLGVRLPDGCPARVSLPALGPHPVVRVNGVPVPTARVGARVVFDIPPGHSDITLS